MESGEIVMDVDVIARMVRRLAHEIVERMYGVEGLVLVGIWRGGVLIVLRLVAAIVDVEARMVLVGSVEIVLYRDDAATALLDLKIGLSWIDFDVRSRDVVLVDDVMQIGRMVRVAIDCLLDYGRLRRIWLVVLLDRGGRELPIALDFVGGLVIVLVGVWLEVHDDRVVCVLRSEL